jgi:hypothetical protein
VKAQCTEGDEATAVVRGKYGVLSAYSEKKIMLY